MGARPLICGAPGVGEEAAAEDAYPYDDEGRPTLAYFKRCHAVVFDVCGFASRVIEGNEFDLFCTLEGTVALRKAFAAMPTALRVIELAFEETLGDEIESWRERFEALSAPLSSEVPTIDELNA